MNCDVFFLESSPRPPLVIDELAARMGLLSLATTRLARASKAWCNSLMIPASDSQRDAISDSVELDRADIRDSLAGDGDAYRRLVERYQQPIADYLWRFTRDRRQWEELVQDVFVEGYLSLPTYTAKAPLLHWLKRIATRVGYRFWKNQQRRKVEAAWTEEADLLTSTEVAVGASEDAAELVQQMLAELAPRDRLVMTLTYLEQRNGAEVAQLTGWSKSMVKVQLHRARKRLAKICEKRGIEP